MYLHLPMALPFRSSRPTGQLPLSPPVLFPSRRRARRTDGVLTARFIQVPTNRGELPLVPLPNRHRDSPCVVPCVLAANSRQFLLQRCLRHVLTSLSRQRAKGKRPSGFHSAAIPLDLTQWPLVGPSGSCVCWRSPCARSRRVSASSDALLWSSPCYWSSCQCALAEARHVEGTIERSGHRLAGDCSRGTHRLPPEGNERSPPSDGMRHPAGGHRVLIDAGLGTILLHALHRCR